MSALIHCATDDPAARYLNPVISVLKGDQAHKSEVSLTTWNSTSTPSLRVRNENTGGESAVFFAANGSTKILAAHNTGVTMAGTLTLTGALVANGGITTTTLKATGAVDFDSTLNVDGATTVAAITASGVGTFNNSLVANGPLLANGDTTLGSAADDDVVVNGTSSFLAPATFSSTLSTESTTNLGNAVGDAVIIAGTATVGSTLGVTGDFSVSTNGFAVTASTNKARVNLAAIIGSADLSVGPNGIATSGGLVLSGPSNIDGNGGTAGQIRIGAVIVGAANLDGTEELLVNGQSRLKGATEITTGGLTTTSDAVRQLTLKGNQQFNGIEIYETNGSTVAAFMGVDTTNDNARMNASPAGYYWDFLTQNASRFRIQENGLSVGGAAGSFGSGVRVIFVQNASTNPSTNPTGGGILYADGGAGKWRGSGGTTTTFGPAEPHCPECGRDFILDWENPKYGRLRICMWCMSQNNKKGVISRAEALDEEAVWPI